MEWLVQRKPGEPRLSSRACARPGILGLYLLAWAQGKHLTSLFHPTMKSPARWSPPSTARARDTPDGGVAEREEGQDASDGRRAFPLRASTSL